MRSMTACKLMEESGNKELPSHYSICPSQLKYQIKKFSLKVNVLFKQLLRSVTYAALFFIRKGIFMTFAYWTIHQLLWSEMEFFIQI